MGPERALVRLAFDVWIWCGMAQQYDYIIVGAGSAGCVLAGRLSADPAKQILLLECGGKNHDFLIGMPKGIGKLVRSPAHCLTYEVGGERLAGQPPEVWVRGKGLGGSSAINGMIWSRGHPQDFDHWERLGCTGWNWQTMKSAYKALEDHPLGPSDAHGSGGPVAISSGTFRYPLTEDMIAAGEMMGLERVEDLNDKPVERVGYYSHNISKGRRVSAAHAYLDPARARANLHILTGARVHRVLFDGNRAVSVAVAVGGKVATFDCRGEIVLSAGLLESPRLLELSGIGPAAVLEAAGVPLLHDSPDVGNRMREHASISMPFRIGSNCGSHRSFFGLGLMRSAIQYQLFHTGALATGPFEVGGFTRIGGGKGPPNLQLYLGGYVFALSDDSFPVPLADVDRRPGMMIYGQLLQLESEGSIHIRSADPSAPPVINPNWLAAENDQRLAIEAIRYIRRYASQPPLRRHIVEELLPGGECQSDEAMLLAFRRLATCGLHGTGTCRMGSDERSVVDERLRVRGVSGLRVADCSVMPGLVSGNTNAPAMATGYRAADLIIDDSR